MTKKEMRELDAWIHLNLFDGDKYVGLKKRGYWYLPNAIGYTDIDAKAGRYTREEAKKHEYPHDEPVTICEFPVLHYSDDPAAALDVLKKCCDKLAINVEVWIDDTKRWHIATPSRKPWADAETIELAICRFAKELYSK